MVLEALTACHGNRAVTYSHCNFPMLFTKTLPKIDLVRLGDCRFCIYYDVNLLTSFLIWQHWRVVTCSNLAHARRYGVPLRKVLVPLSPSRCTRTNNGAIQKKKENVSTFDRTEPGGSVTVGAVLYSWYSMEAYKNLIFRAPGFSYLFNEPPYTTRRPNLEATLTGIEVSLISIAFIAPKVPSKCAYE